MGTLATPASHLGALHPALKQCWSARLRRLPAGRPGAGLVSPEMLVLMVDGTIARLVELPPERRHAHPTPRFMTPRAGCQCGFNLLVNYYVAGAWALREVLPPGAETDRRRVVRGLIRLARDELAALCGVCQHRGGSLCQLGDCRGCPCNSGKSPAGHEGPPRIRARPPV